MPNQLTTEEKDNIVKEVFDKISFISTVYGINVYGLSDNLMKAMIEIYRKGYEDGGKLEQF